MILISIKGYFLSFIKQNYKIVRFLVDIYYCFILYVFIHTVCVEKRSKKSSWSQKLRDSNYLRFLLYLGIYIWCIYYSSCYIYITLLSRLLILQKRRQFVCKIIYYIAEIACNVSMVVCVILYFPKCSFFFKLFVIYI